AAIEPGAGWYDLGRLSVLVAGGQDVNAGTYVSDAWSWDGVAVQPVMVDFRPPVRKGAIWCADPVRRNVVLHGGSAFHSGLTDTWTWDGIRWTRHYPLLAPSARQGAIGAFDLARGNLVLFGGFLWLRFNPSTNSTSPSPA